MKYKFTGKTKLHFGRTLHQIVCVTAFASIAAGEVGGWIEKDKNLDQSGNAWVHGNAQVYGDARVSGNAQVYGGSRATTKVLTINSNYYHITITDKHIAIGCQQHTIKQWAKMSRKKIVAMDGEKTADLWEKSKDFILMLANQ